MRIRKLEERDLPYLRKWHEESGVDYEFPDLLAEPFTRVTVVVDEEDRPVQALAAKRTIEMYMLLDPTWRNPRWRLGALMQGHEEMRSWLEKHGWPEVNAFLPPQVEKSFGRRLEKIFHWIPGRWRHYSRRTEATGHEQRRNKTCAEG